MKKYIFGAIAFLMMLAVIVFSAITPMSTLNQWKYSQTPVYTVTPLATPTPTLEPWRIEPLPGYTAICYDTDDSKVCESSALGMIQLAIELKLEPPFKWERFLTEKKFKDAAFYYTPILRKKGYGLTYNNQDKSGMGWLIFKDDKGNTIYVLLMDGDDTHLSDGNVFYDLNKSKTEN